jgi:hypothetical protein
MQAAIRLSIGALGCLAAAAMAVSAMAQSASVEAGVTANRPNQFRDSTTGKLWTPETVGQDNRLSRDNKLEPPNQPAAPADRAFDPKAQIATAGAITVQRPRANVMGTVPVTAGPARRSSASTDRRCRLFPAIAGLPCSHHQQQRSRS